MGNPDLKGYLFVLVSKCAYYYSNKFHILVKAAKLETCIKGSGVIRASAQFTIKILKPLEISGIFKMRNLYSVGIIHALLFVKNLLHVQHTKLKIKKYLHI